MSEWMTDEERREYAAMLLRDYRGVETPCADCGGWGVRAYSSTARWRGGIGGQAITSGVCDKCWGSGDESRPGADLREVEATLLRAEKAEAEVARLREDWSAMNKAADRFCADWKAALARAESAEAESARLKASADAHEACKRSWAETAQPGTATFGPDIARDWKEKAEAAEAEVARLTRAALRTSQECPVCGDDISFPSAAATVQDAPVDAILDGEESFCRGCNVRARWTGDAETKGAVVLDYDEDRASVRDAALAEAQAVAERCCRERGDAIPACIAAGGALESLTGKESEARRIADEIAKLRRKA